MSRLVYGRLGRGENTQNSVTRSISAQKEEAQHALMHSVSINTSFECGGSQGILIGTSAGSSAFTDISVGSNEGSDVHKLRSGAQP